MTRSPTGLDPPSHRETDGRALRSGALRATTLESLSRTYDRATRKASNDGRREIFGNTHRMIAFVCECGATACYETVRLTTDEFDRLRPDAVVARGHEAAA